MLLDCNACMQIGQDGPPTKHSVQQLPLSCIVHLLGHLVGSLPLKHGLSRIANACLFLCYHTCPDSRVLNSLVGGSSVTVTGAVSLGLQNAVYMYFNHRCRPTTHQEQNLLVEISSRLTDTYSDHMKMDRNCSPRGNGPGGPSDRPQSRPVSPAPLRAQGLRLHVEPSSV